MFSNLESLNSNFVSTATVTIGPIPLAFDVEVPLAAETNPGIGGSEFFLIRLASFLANSGLTVRVLTVGANLTFADSRIFTTNFVQSLEESSVKTGVYITNSGIPRAYRGFFQMVDALIVVSHHPHDGDLRALLRSVYPSAIVSLGEYQYISNALVKVPHFWIPGFVQKPVLQSNLPSKKIGHISSMHPSKGFHLIARAWVKVQGQMDLNLEVIGGLSLYGVPEEDSKFHTSKKYGAKLQKIFQKDNSLSKVKLMGRVPGDVGEFIQNWRFAVLNPKGTAEADPTSVKDCLRQGVPVVAGFDYGMRHYLKAFPETRLSSPKDLGKKILNLYSHPDLVRILSDRARDYYSHLYERNAEVEAAWLRLVRAVHSNKQSLRSLKTRDIGFTPEEPFLFKIRIHLRSIFYFPFLRFAQDWQALLSTKIEGLRRGL